jgi:YHS domain-containing protein
MVVALLLAGALQNGEPVNAKCPVKPGEKAAADFTVNYKGKVIGFCCRDCQATFEEKPAEFAAKIPELKGPAGPPPPINENCPVTYLHPNSMKANPRYPVTISGKTVAFCCDGCRNKFIRAPDQYLVNLPEITGKKAEPKAAPEKKGPDAKKDEEGKDAKPAATGPCDVKKLVKGHYCVSCARELAMDDVRGTGVTLICKRCDTKPLTIEYCLKVVRGPAQPGNPSGLVEDRARISFECGGCGAKADLEADLKHTPTCKPLFGGPKKVCSKSGTAPHASDK